jgi:hypothetical protein
MKRTQLASPVHALSYTIDYRSNKCEHTPTKQVDSLSSLLCPPSPHHNPRASSPLRSSPISQMVIIRRPEQRQPLSQLTVTLQGPGNSSRRITSKDFELYEDTSPFKYTKKVARKFTVSPTRNNNKKNITPRFAPSSKEQSDNDMLVRPQPRGSLTKLKQPDQTSEQMSVSESKSSTVLTEDLITTGYFERAAIVHKTQVNTVSTSVTKRNVSENIMSKLKMRVEEIWNFDIHQDNLDYQDTGEYDVGIVILESEEDKENVDPGISAGSDEMDWQDTRLPRSGKRKHTEDWK